MMGERGSKCFFLNSNVQKNGGWGGWGMALREGVNEFFFDKLTKNPNLKQKSHEALNRSPEYTGQSQTFNFEI